MKKLYEEPMFQLISLASVDVITASPADSREDNFDDGIIEIG